MGIGRASSIDVGAGEHNPMPACAPSRRSFGFGESATAACPRPIDSNPIRHTHPTPVVHWPGSTHLPRRCGAGSAGPGRRWRPGARSCPAEAEGAGRREKKSPSGPASSRRKRVCLLFVVGGSREGGSDGSTRAVRCGRSRRTWMRWFMWCLGCVNWAGLAGSIDRSIIRSH